MADITRIFVKVWTADDMDAAANDGTAYLGVAGREFVLDNPGGNFQRGQHQVFVFGEDATVNLPEFNDPRKPQLTTDDIDRYPVYIRYTGDDGWGLSDAFFRVDSGESQLYTFFTKTLSTDRSKGPIWLRSDAGQVLYLRRMETEVPDPAQAPSRSQETHSAETRTVYGNVDKDGRKESGSDDFWVSREGPGRYTIGFNSPYTSTPSATATVTGDGWVVLDNAQIAAIDTHHVLIVTGDDHGQYGDRPFSFHIIGPA
ncbi:hypothetical protein SUDANB108_00027 [Streptomyces sp. enrichment culture]|uniref:hypothetical protein n=1 Tax=Streptomyces sp. enrichment culture TaxID=1795815 RepID=UPI003F543211